MKSILLSMRPEHAVNVLNGKKTLELRTNIPKDLKEIIKEFGGIWVYIYVTQQPKSLVKIIGYDYDVVDNTLTKDQEGMLINAKTLEKLPYCKLNQKVVARFWLDEYDEMSYMTCNGYEYDYYATNNKDKAFGWCVDSNYIEDFCLEYQDILNYGYNKKKRKQVNLYAWHIKNLEIFDKPKELREFKTKDISKWQDSYGNPAFDDYFEVNKPPQSWQYVYVKESKDE